MREWVEVIFPELYELEDEFHPEMRKTKIFQR